MQNGNGYQNFGDMFDGGGAGASGQSFEGGGLLSMIANLISKPRGSQQGQPQEPMGGLLSAQPAQPLPMMPQSAPQYSGRGNLGMPTPGQPMVSQGAGVPNVNGASLQELEALHQQMVAAGILPSMPPQMQRGPF